MNPERRTYNTAVFLLIIFIVIISFVCVINKRSGSAFRGSSEKVLQRRRIRLLYYTDHEELLKAGRGILRQGPKDLKNYHYYGPMHIDGFPVPGNVRIPKVVKKLRPHAVLINFSGYVVLQMHENVIERFGLRIYPEDFKTRSRYFSYGNKQLLPGLWYYDRDYHNNPRYDKVIDYVIQNGKWVEPNQIDLNKVSK